MKVLILFLFFPLIGLFLHCLNGSSGLQAWDGQDCNSGEYIEIDKGNLVREDVDIEVYHSEDGDYHYEEVQDFDGHELETYDYDTGEFNTYEMEE